MMRGTFKINNSNSLLYINKNYANYSKVMTQISLQQQVVDLEDNPLAANIGIKTLGLLEKSKQYVSNLQTGIDSLSHAESYLRKALENARSINSKLVEGAHDSKNQAQRSALATEVGDLLKALVQIANGNDGTRYCFGGQQTTNPPFTIVNGRYVNYTGNNSLINLMMDNNTTIPINVAGSDAFGNSQTKIPSRDMNPGINMTTDHSTRLRDLNGGDGVPKGKVMVYYSAYPDGLEVDLSGCDTVEDVKDAIESQTLAASKALDPASCPWLDASNLDWRDMQDRYVQVTLNPQGNGISLQEIDKGEPLPEPTTLEQRRGLDYSAYAAGSTGVSADGKPTTVFDKTGPDGRRFTNLRVDDYAQNKVAEALGIKGSASASGSSRVKGFLHGRDLDPRISDSTLLADLEGYNDGGYTITNGGKPGSVYIRETSQDPNNVFNNWYLNGLSKGQNCGKDGELYARAYTPPSTVEANTTFDAPLTIQGPATFKQGQVFDEDVKLDKVVYNLTENYMFKKGQIFEKDMTLPDGTTLKAGTALSADTIFDAGTEVQISTFKAGTALPQDITLSKGKTVALTKDVTFLKGTDFPRDPVVELYSVPVDKAGPSHLVATGTYTQNKTGGTVIFSEANSSGISGSVGVNMPSSMREATVSLKAQYDDEMRDTVSVPAFEEEQDEYGRPKDVLNIASGWNIRGLDKPPATGYDVNHPASTDLNGNVSVNYRRDGDKLIVELCRPAFGDQPAALIASGELHLGADNFDADGRLKSTVSGRVEFQGAEGFEGVSGSVYLELPHGTGFSGQQTAGTSANDPTTNTYALPRDYATGADPHTIRLGGAMELGDQVTFDEASSFRLTADTVFKKGQVFENDVNLPGGGILKAGEPLDRDTAIPRGTDVSVRTIEAGTVLPEGTRLTFKGSLPAGTVIPRGSYVESPVGAGFPADDMGMSVKTINPYTGQPEVTATGKTAGHDVRATFATVEDFKRAVAEKGIHANVEISEDGKGLQFSTNLAGAWLTVSEDPDCYEQMGDIHQQLSGLDLDGLVKGVTSDVNGNVYTEVVYYPPPPPSYDSDGNLITSTKVQLVSDSGETYEIEAGYYVRVYNDPDQLNHAYENRDNGKLMAEGFVPAGEWNPEWTKDPKAAEAAGLPPFLPDNGTLGNMPSLILEERNGSGVNGRVDLNYYGSTDNPSYATNPDGTLNHAAYNNSNITVFPGGLRPQNTVDVNIQEVDIHKPTPGVTCDYNGTFHGKAEWVEVDDPNNPGNRIMVPQVTLYKDASRTTATVRSDPNEPVGADGRVTLYELDRHGNYATTATGERIVAGTMVLDASELPEDATENFEIKTGGMRNGGQDREENIFSTINDIIDALNQNDSERANALIGTLAKDVSRIEQAEADVSSRWNRMLTLKERHGDDQIRFQTTFNSRVGMDDAALSAAVMDYKAATEAFQAAMQVSSTIMQMSLLQYI